MTAGPENITTITEEMVMAYADGALSRPLADRVEAALGQDPAMAAQVERHRRTRALAAAAVAPVLDEPVPARLIAAAQANDGQKRFGASRFLVQGGAAGMALAASFAAGFVLAPKPPVADIVAQADGIRAAGALAQALSGQASGEAADGVRIALTAPNQDGGYCRAFHSGRGGQSLEGVACVEGDSKGGDWRIVALHQAEAAGDSAGYRTAAGALSPALMIALDQRRSGDPLGAEEERAAIAAGFKPRG